MSGVVRDIQQQRPTPLIGFGLREHRGEVGFISSIPAPFGGTPIASAINFAREQNFGRAVVISDGSPTESTHECMDAAARFGGKVDVVFVGDPGDPGAEFLLKLAESTGGTSFTGDLSEPKELGAGVIGLLTGEVAEDEDEDDEDLDDEDLDDEEV
jgi:hypothetical protein